MTVDERPCRRTVVDRYPFAAIEAQQQVCAGDQRMGNAHVGAQVTSDDHIVAWRETCAVTSPIEPSARAVRADSSHKYWTLRKHALAISPYWDGQCRRPFTGRFKIWTASAN